MESFAHIIVGLNKSFVKSTSIFHGQHLVETTCIYVVYFRDRTVQIFNAMVSTDRKFDLKRCHYYAEEIVISKVISYLYENYRPNVKAGKIRLIGQKDVKTYTRYDTEVDVENHSHYVYPKTNDGYTTRYVIVLKFKNTNNVQILIGKGVADQVGDSVRLARKDAESKLEKIVSHICDEIERKLVNDNYIEQLVQDKTLSQLIEKMANIDDDTSSTDDDTSSDDSDDREVEDVDHKVEDIFDLIKAGLDIQYKESLARQMTQQINEHKF